MTEPVEPESPRRRATSTSAFGSGRRESHDATDFYARFSPPELDADDAVATVELTDDGVRLGDSRSLDLPDRSIALVVTSPPYFAGKEYEEALGVGHVPESYLAYLQLLRDVFDECKRVLEPGGRIAVNVANLGRKPYRSLAADVIHILQDELGLLLRGEIVWVKGEGATGSCAWGSYRSAANPVLRDLSERVIVASKGRFDRARTAARRKAEGLPHVSTTTSDEFMAATLDVWELAPERARRVGHPAPFPVELPQRLIELYTYEGDVVLDPFMGSGTTLVAAARAGRRGVGYDMEAAYVAIARERVREEGHQPRLRQPEGSGTAVAIAERLLMEAGFVVLGRRTKPKRLGISVDLVAADGDGAEWFFEVAGAFTTPRTGLLRSETALRAIGKAAILSRDGSSPVVLLTTHLPERRTEPDAALRAAGPAVLFDVIELLSAEGAARLCAYAKGGHRAGPLPGFWANADLDG